MRRELVQENDTAHFHLQGQRFHIRQQLRFYRCGAVRMMFQVPHFENIRHHVHTPTLNRGVYQWNPAGDDLGAIRLFPRHTGILVPGHVVVIVRSVDQMRGRLGADMLDG